MRNIRRTSVALGVALIVLAVGSSDAAERSAYETVLVEKNIQPTRSALSKYLRELHPDESQLDRVKALIEQLGDTDSFQTREAAMAKLLVMPTLPTEELLLAAGGDDPEIRWRAKKVLDIGEPESTKVMHAAFRVIADQKLPGLVSELLAAIRLCDQRHLLAAASDALVASARQEDTKVLRTALNHQNAEVRVGAVRSLENVLGEASLDDLRPVMKDPDGKVKLAAARALANHGERQCLPTLLALLESDDLLVRVSSSAALRQLSGKQFEFAAYDTADRRTKAVDRWRAWIEDNGQTAKLNFPLKSFRTGVGYLGGNMLLSFGHNNTVVEYNPDGKEIWSYTSRGAFSAEKMANGNVLMAEYNGSRVIEVDPEGEIVWEHQVTNAINAKALENGNILIAAYPDHQAVEVSRDKRIVWQFKTQSHCSDVHRLESGNTLIACYGAPVVEVTPDGKTVWEYNGVTKSFGCQPLENGNVLIADYDGNRVVEVNRDKQVVWEFQENTPGDVFRLPNGNTLITGTERFVEVTPDKKVAWSKSGCSFGTARR